MNTSNTTLRSPAFLVVVGLASLLGSLGGCIIDAKIGDDPLGGSEAGTTHGDTEGGPEDSSTTAFPGTASATSAGPGTATASTTSAGDGGSVSATGAGPGVDPETALELCGVVVVPPVPGEPFYQEGILCELGCVVDVVSAEATGIADEETGQCVCEAMACGDMSAGTTGSLPGDTDGEPDGCGPFPPGDGGFTCACEMCSIDVTNVDATWVEGEADLPAICECMCGGAGCGAPA